MTWQPSDRAGLILWFHAGVGVYNDAGTTLATNGQTVRQWNDRSATGANISQATSGNRPTFQTAGFNTSYKTVSFTNSLHTFLQTAADALPAPNVTKVSAFVVGQVANNAGSTNFRALSMVGTGPDDFNTADGWALMRETTNQNVNGYCNGTQFSITAITYDTPMRFGAILDGANGTCYVNNVAGTPTSLSSSNFNHTQTFAVGESVNEVRDAYFEGKISEIVVYSDNLNPTDRGLLDTYFQQQWFGLSVGGITAPIGMQTNLIYQRKMVGY